MQCRMKSGVYPKSYRNDSTYMYILVLLILVNCKVKWSNPIVNLTWGNRRSTTGITKDKLLHECTDKRLPSTVGHCNINIQ